MELEKIKGVGPKTLKHLNSLGIYSIGDALTYYPRDYEDRNNIKPVSDMKDGEMISFIGETSIIYGNRRTATGKTMIRILFKSDLGYITGVWFNQPYIKNTFKVGESVFIFGRVSRKMGEVQIIDPQYEKNIDSTPMGILPVYSTNKYLSQKILRKTITQALNYVDDVILECIPESIRKVYKLLDIKTTLTNIHFPSNMQILNLCKRRIKFEELLTLQLGLFLIKKNIMKNDNAFSIPVCREMKNFKESIPFELTGAQSKTIREILTDMKKSKPMNRLVQGDVGSGKTIVAIIALFNCAKNGYQGAMMAPTEILAEQHFESINNLLGKWGIKVGLITGSTPRGKKKEIIEGISSGGIDVIVGTHALIQEGVEFNNLSLVITDEQHRFGVRQRAELINKGHNPHVLVMTATPIPRTLALFLYGDMDISIINEMPKGRQSISTHFIKASGRNRIYNSLISEIKNGRQAYVVCPLVEESEKLQIESAVETEKNLKEKYFKNFRVGLLHGKMTSKEKDETMHNFKAGFIDVLVSTTVIEVGVNVPNATVMVIENAERFGLAQLHQLRGRVGRGTHKSYCILISEGKNQAAIDRMKIMTSTGDGFIIAEKDMELRGTGEFFGIRQHGLPELKMADIIKDIDILKETRDLAREIIDKDYLNNNEYSLMRNSINKYFDEKVENITFN